MLKFKTPFPPSVNHMYGQFRNRIYLKKIGREYKEACAVLLKGLPSFVDRVKVEVGVNFPDLRKRDLDNLLKPTLDAIQDAKIIRNDSLVKDLRIFELGIDRENPGLEIRIVDLEMNYVNKFTI
jgi:crossover junction endodeoxyribonuclease RusA